MRNTLGPQNPKAIMISMKIIFFALCSGIVFFAIASYFVSMQPGQVHADKSIDDIFIIIVPVFALISISAGYFLYRSKLQLIKDNPEMLVKCQQFQVISIIKFALIEAPALFAIVSYMLTTNYIYLAVAGLILVVFLINFPSKTKIQNDIEINTDDFN